MSLTVALLGAAGGVLAWIAKLRWSAEYRAAVDARIAAQDEVIKSKDAQLGVIQEALRAKDATIENLKVFTYAEAAKHLASLKDVYEQRLTETQDELTRLAGELDKTAAQLSNALAESARLRKTVEQSATLTRQAVGTLADLHGAYADAINRLNTRDDDLAAIQRGSIQAMEEANRIGLQGRGLSRDWTVDRHIGPDLTGGANMG